MTRPSSSTSIASVAALALCLCGPVAHAQEPPSSAAALEADAPHALVLPQQAGTFTRYETAPKASVWRDLFTDTVRDARHFPSKQTLGWLAIGAAAAAGSRPADSHVGRSLSSAKTLEEPLEPGAVIGSTPLQLGMSAATYAIGRAAGWPRMTVVAADLFRAQLLAQGLTMGVKESVRRRRPEGGGFAFPSGHTTVSFASATVLQQHLGWRMGAPAYALATYVALSRVQMQRHYLSDVAFGAALGIAAGRSVTLGREKRMHLSPMAAGGGGGVQFTWVGRP